MVTHFVIVGSYFLHSLTEMALDLSFSFTFRVSSRQPKREKYSPASAQTGCRLPQCRNSGP